MSIGAVLLTYDRSYACHDEHLLKIYLFVLSGLHLIMAILEMSIVTLSASGTIANPHPRRNIRIPLYITTAVFFLEFAWDVVGVIWAFDPTIDCHKSHTVLLVTRCVLVWNFIGSISFGLYLIFRIGKSKNASPPFLTVVVIVASPISHCGLFKLNQWHGSRFKYTQ